MKRTFQHWNNGIFSSNLLVSSSATVPANEITILLATHRAVVQTGGLLESNCNEAEMSVNVGDLPP